MKKLPKLVSPSHAWLLAGACLAGLSLIAADAAARAGGGGNYTGGGGSGGGGGIGGDGGGELIIWLLYLAVRHPKIGVPLLAIVVVGMVIKSRMNPDNTTARAIRSLEDAPPPDTSGLSDVKSRDPAFDEARFLDWVRRVDDQVQGAWSHGDMTPVRSYLSDGMLRTFSTQLAIMKHQGRRNPVADHTVHACRIHAVEHDAHFDTIHVAIEASARDIEVDAELSHEEAMRKARAVAPRHYTEVWSFLRKPGTLTLEDKGFIQGKCPNCGAPIENVQASKCGYCDALVNSGDYDWVLAEITQTLEWRASSSGRQVVGLERLSDADQTFNRQAAEDRATYVFWRWLEASVTGSSTPLAKCASPSVGREVGEGGPRPHFKSAVGSVDLVQCEVGTATESTPEPVDRFFAKVLWSSAAAAASAPSHHAHVLAFSRIGRKADATGLSHARCHSCMGPLDENDSTTCAYCGAELAAGRGDWVLEAILQPFEMRQISSDQEVQAQLPSADGEPPAWATPDLSSPQERRLLLMAMAAMVMADGIATRSEKRLLRSAAKRWGVPYNTINPVLYGQIAPEELAQMRPSDPRLFLDGLIGAALVDGRIDRKERALMLDVARNAGLPQEQALARMKELSARNAA